MEDSVFTAIKRHPLFAAAVIVAVVLLAVLMYPHPTGKSDHKKKDAEVYELSLGHNMPPGSAMYIAAQGFADTVRDRTGGRVQINIFPAQQLGDDYKMIDMTLEGKLDILLSPAPKLSMILPAMQYTDIPFLFPRVEDAYAMLDGKPGALLLERLKHEGLVGVAFWGNGFKQFISRKPIHSPSDFNGLNIRIINNEIISDQFTAFGAKPVPIEFYQSYEALKRKEVDGQENSVAAIYGIKLYEVASNLTMSNHAYLAYVFCFNKNKLDSLPADIVQTLMSTAKELTSFQRGLIKKEEDNYIKAIEKAGINVINLNEQQLRQFQKATAHIIDKYRIVIGEDVIDLTTEYLKAKYHTKQEDDIVIGLSADMSKVASLTGMAIMRGMELAINEINSQGGVLGKKLSIVVMDHGGSYSRSEKNVKTLSQIKNLVAIMGGIHGLLIMGDLEHTHKEKIIYLIPWAAGDKITNNPYNPNYVFRVSINDVKAGRFLVQQALKRSEKIAFLLVNNAWGKENGRIMADYLLENNLKPSAVEFFNMGEENMLQQFQKIGNSGAEVLIVVAIPGDRLPIINGITLLKKKIQILSHMTLTSSGYFFQDVPDSLKKVDLRFIQTFSFLTPDNALTQKVLTKYLKTYKVSTPQEIPIPVATAHAYDLVHLLAIAIKNAGTTDRSSVRDALENIREYKGLIKTYSPPFTKTRHDALDVNDYFLATYDANGAIVPVDKRAK
ncbi:MAG: DctP family TRAP transporter solute-binding subunit [Nitrospirae bacterium]|nr:DctP family TRAP transporter solute-binding subunit [Nitrospirota bacterium]